MASDNFSLAQSFYQLHSSIPNSGFDSPVRGVVLLSLTGGKCLGHVESEDRH